MDSPKMNSVSSNSISPTPMPPTRKKKEIKQGYQRNGYQHPGKSKKGQEYQPRHQLNKGRAARRLPPAAPPFPRRLLPLLRLAAPAAPGLLDEDARLGRRGAGAPRLPDGLLAEALLELLPALVTAAPPEGEDPDDENGDDEDYYHYEPAPVHLDPGFTLAGRPSCKRKGVDVPGLASAYVLPLGTRGARPRPGVVRVIRVVVFSLHLVHAAHIREPVLDLHQRLLGVAIGADVVAHALDALLEARDVAVVAEALLVRGLVAGGADGRDAGAVGVVEGPAVGGALGPAGEGDDGRLGLGGGVGWGGFKVRVCATVCAWGYIPIFAAAEVSERSDGRIARMSGSDIERERKDMGVSESRDAQSVVFVCVGGFRDHSTGCSDLGRSGGTSSPGVRRGSSPVHRIPHAGDTCASTCAEEKRRIGIGASSSVSGRRRERLRRA